MWDALPDWAGLTILISIISSMVGIGLALLMIIRMPADHFVCTDNGQNQRHPALHIVWVCVKNVLGIAILILGVAMMVLPGPGLLAVLLGLSIIDLPGKQWLMRRGLQFKSVRTTLNWIRKKAGCSRLQFPEKPD